MAHIVTHQPFLGIEDRVLKFTDAERKTLIRAAGILEKARALVGEDTDLGQDLGGGEVRCWEYGQPGGTLVSTRTAEITAEQILGF